METSPDIVAAAEALRTWVHAQRASWAEPTAVPKVRATPTPAPHPPEPIPLPVVNQPISTPALDDFSRSEIDEPIIPRPASLPVPPSAPAVPLAPLPVPAAPVATTVDRPPTTPAIHIDVEETSSSRFEKWRVAVAAALVIAVVGAGSRAVWRRSAPVPRVGTAAVDSAPPGAQVFVDGKPVGTTPVRVELNPGPHGVEFKLKQATRTQTIEIQKGVELPVNIEWNPRRTGTLEVASTPAGAKVLVDGRERGQTPLTLTDLGVGAHTVQIESSEGSVSRKVDIGEGRTESIAEAIYPGWLLVSAPIEVTVSDGGKGVQLDATNRVLMKPGVHTIRLDNRELEFTQIRQVQIEPGGVARLSVEVPQSTLSVTGSSGADVFVDGTSVGVTPLDKFQIKIGTREIMVTDRSSGITRNRTVTVTTRPAHVEIPLTGP
jgi:hypothetical protein